MKKIIFSSLETAINKYLALDPESEQRLIRLKEKKAVIIFLPLNITIQCSFGQNGISLSSPDETPPNVTLRGTPLQLAGMMLAKKNRQQFFADDLEMTGDAELGQQIVELFDQVEIDWEEHAAKLVGDVAAYQSGRVLKNVFSTLKNIDNSLSKNIDEFLHEEIQVLPPREALHDFFNDIDTIRMDVDRLAAKVELLKKQMLATETNSATKSSNKGKK